MREIRRGKRLVPVPLILRRNLVSGSGIPFPSIDLEILIIIKLFCVQRIHNQRFSLNSNVWIRILHIFALNSWISKEDAKKIYSKKYIYIYMEMARLARD